MSAAPNVEKYSQLNQISDGNPDGLQIGQSTTDQIAFYGKVPLPQRILASAALAGYVSTAYTASASASTTQSVGGIFNSLTASAQSALGNWTTIASSSLATAAASNSVTLTVNGWTCTNASLSSSGASGMNAVQTAILNEVCLTLIGLGIWKAI